MVAGADDEEGYVGCGKADEGYGSAIGSDDSCEQACGKEQEAAGTLDVDSEVGSIAFAKEDGIERFDKQGGEEDAKEAEGGKDGHLLHGDTVEVAHAPDDEALNVLSRGEEVEQGDDGRGEVAYHDACDEEHEIVFKYGGEEDEECHDRHAAYESCSYDGKSATEGIDGGGYASAEGKDDNGYSEVGSCRYAEDGGTG